jgi:hypothetical protein
MLSLSLGHAQVFYCSIHLPTILRLQMLENPQIPIYRKTRKKGLLVMSVVGLCQKWVIIGSVLTIEIIAHDYALDLFHIIYFKHL